MAATASDPAVQIQPCPVTRTQAAKIPGLQRAGG